jgi:hypothetical protein
MVVDILNKVLLVLLFLSFLNILRHSYYFVQAFLINSDENPIKYKLNKTSLILLGISISYILSVFFTGVKIN